MKSYEKLLLHIFGIALIISAYFVEWDIAERSLTVEPQPQVYEELSEWQILQMALAKTESEFNPLAVGKSNDLGIIQITRPYVDEINRIQDTVIFQHTDAFDISKSYQMFNIYQEKKNPNKDIPEAIRLQNPKGDAIGYSSRVMKNMEFVVTMEEVRRTIIEGNYE